MIAEQDAPTGAQITKITPPRIGEIWPGQGGIYLGIAPGSNGQADYHLIRGTEPSPELEWGTYGADAPGANSPRDGKANTAALLASGNSHPAAEWASKYCADGHNDFYLPARYESALDYANTADEKSSGYCWISTQDSAHDAWVQNFGNGYQGWLSKDYTARVRPVRRFPV